ncbi:MFS transporter [Secundilactobacillus kimchicus]|uniref:MFS transporter n=1 Tax=Secundilactobacillus kimchicus TaxID=528209 RepID=UPI0034E391AC
MQPLFFFGVGDCICATATQFPVLLFGRIIQAGGVGFSGPLLTNLILATVPSHRLGTYLGFANLIILVGPALGPSFGGLIVNVASWRLIFLVDVTTSNYSCGDWGTKH